MNTSQNPKAPRAHIVHICVYNIHIYIYIYIYIFIFILILYRIYLGLYLDGLLYRYLKAPKGTIYIYRYMEP